MHRAARAAADRTSTAITPQPSLRRILERVRDHLVEQLAEIFTSAAPTSRTVAARAYHQTVDSRFSISSTGSV